MLNILLRNFNNKDIEKYKNCPVQLDWNLDFFLLFLTGNHSQGSPHVVEEITELAYPETPQECYPTAHLKSNPNFTLNDLQTLRFKVRGFHPWHALSLSVASYKNKELKKYGLLKYSLLLDFLLSQLMLFVIAQYVSATLLFHQVSVFTA